jgi:hypothetical protein
MRLFFDGFYDFIKSFLPPEAKKQLLPVIIATFAAFFGIWLFWTMAVARAVGNNLKDVLKVSELRNNAYIFVAAFILTYLTAQTLGAVFRQTNTFTMIGIILTFVALYDLLIREKKDIKKLLILVILSSVFVSKPFLKTVGMNELISQLRGRVHLIDPRFPLIGGLAGFLTFDLKFLVVFGYTYLLLKFAEWITKNQLQSTGNPPQEKS